MTSLVANAHPRPADRLTRVTLLGPHRRIDLVLPSVEPLGLLLPEIVDMMGCSPEDDRTGYQVSTLDGQVLDLACTLRDGQVPDGALLRVDELADAPPAATVHDVSDEVSDDLDRRSGRWGQVAAAWTATASSAAAAAAAALLATAVPDAVVAGSGLLIAVIGVAVGIAGRRRPRTALGPGTALLLCGAAFAATTVPGWADEWPQRAMLWTAGLGLLAVLLGLAAGQRRAGLLAGGSVLVLLGGWAGLLGAGLVPARVATIMAVISVGVIGALPRLAMVTSGLTRLDDRRSDGEPVARVSAQSAADSAHRGLALACLSTAVSAGLAGVLLTTGTPSAWTLTLAGLIAVTLGLRARAFPLTSEVVALLGAALAIGGGLLLSWTRTAPDQWFGPASVALGVAVLTLSPLLLRLSPHMRARLRQVADRVEAVVVIAQIPVAVGAFGMYSRLFDTF